jgi:hypothetical protein
MNKVTPEEVQQFIARHDEAYGGRLSSFYNYSRVVSLTWFEKIVAALNIAEQEYVGIVSGSTDEPELRLLKSRRITLLNFDSDPRYDLDLSWSDQASENFSLTLCNQVLEHVFNPHQAFRNLIHHTRNGGLIFVSIPAVNCAHGEPNYYSAGYHPRFLARLAQANNLNLVGLSSWGSIRYMVHAVSGTWLPNSGLRPGYQTAADLRFPGLVFSDGRKEDCDYAKAMGFGAVVTDCWALYQKPPI